MKNTAIIALTLILCYSLFLNHTMQKAIEKLEDEAYNLNEGVTIIWNDTTDSVPPDGELVQVEFTKGDTLYLGPIQDEGVKNFLNYIDIPGHKLPQGE